MKVPRGFFREIRVLSFLHGLYLEQLIDLYASHEREGDYFRADLSKLLEEQKRVLKGSLDIYGSLVSNGFIDKRFNLEP